MYVGVAASFVAPQKDADRIGTGNYIICNFGTQTSIGLCTPREPLPNSPLIFCVQLAKVWSFVFGIYCFYRLLYIAFILIKSIGYPDQGQSLALRNSIRTCGMHITTKFVIIDEIYMRT